MIKNYRFIARSISYVFILLHSDMVFSMEQTPAVDEEPYSLRSKKAPSKKDQTEIREREDTTHTLKPQSKLKKIKKESIPNIQASEGSHSRPSAESLIQVEQSEFSWPTLVSNNESWKQAAVRAADSWGMTQEEYLKEANDFLKNYRVLYRKTKILTDLIPLTRPLYSNDKSRKFAFKEGY